MVIANVQLRYLTSTNINHTLSRLIISLKFKQKSLFYVADKKLVFCYENNLEKIYIVFCIEDFD